MFCSSIEADFVGDVASEAGVRGHGFECDLETHEGAGSRDEAQEPSDTLARSIYHQQRRWRKSGCDHIIGSSRSRSRSRPTLANADPVVLSRRDPAPHQAR